jgi:NADPH-dependent curcumin reductase CurA
MKMFSFDYASQFGRALDEMAGWLAEGSLQRKFHIVDGLQNAPSALTMLYNGGNTGKLYVFQSPLFRLDPWVLTVGSGL